MSSEWEIQKISALGDFDRGKSKHRPRDAKHLYGGPYPFIQTGDITNSGGRILAYRQTYSEAGLAQSRIWPKGTLAITIAANIAETGILNFPACFPDSVVGFTANPEKADVRYIEYLFQAMRKQVKSHAYGSAQENINLEVLRRLEFPIPDLKSQKKIADFLSLLDDRIQLLRETNATLEAMAQALFKSWFVDFDPVHAKQQGRAPEGMDAATAALFPDSFEESELGMVPKGWGVAKLGEVTELITKGTTPTTLKRKFVDSGVTFVKAESMTGDGGFNSEKFAFIDEETHTLLKRSQLKEGDVLISIAGTFGRIAVMSADFLPANTNQAVALIRPLAEVFPGGLINRFLRLCDSQQAMSEKVVQAVQANLSLGTLSDMRLVVPPVSVVSVLYQSGIAQLDESWLTNDRRIRNLATLRDTLLPRLISGQLRLPEAEKCVEAVEAI